MLEQERTRPVGPEEERTGLHVLLERVVMAWGSNFVVFLATSALFCLPMLVFNMGIAFFPLNATLNQVVSLLLATVAVVYASAAAAVVLDDAQEARETSKGTVREIRVRSDITVASVTTRVLGHTAGLLPTALFSGGLIYLGLLLLYVPAVVPFLWTIFAGPIVMIEDTTNWGAVQRGRELVADGRWINMLIVTVVFALIVFVTNSLAPTFFKVRDLLTHNESTWQKLLLQGGMGLLDVALLSLWAVWVATAFHDIIEELRKTPRTSPPPAPTPVRERTR